MLWCQVIWAGPHTQVTWSIKPEALYRGYQVSSWLATRLSWLLCIVYKTLVRSLLEYCCPFWNPVKVTEIQLLEGVQRTFTSRIGGMENINYWERLSHLKLMSLQRRTEWYSILMIWKILQNVAPNCCGIRLAETSRYSSQGGSKLWDTVPENSRAAVSFELF
jgi:hypothetical protein